jgi:hypothetical protein
MNVILLTGTNTLDISVACIFRAEEYALKMEAACSSKKLVPIYWSILCHIPEDGDLNIL